MTRRHTEGQGPYRRGRGSDEGVPRSGTASERGESDPLPRRERGKGRKGGERRCSSLHRRVGVAEEVARIRREIQATRAESERARAELGGVLERQPGEDRPEVEHRLGAPQRARQHRHQGRGGDRRRGRRRHGGCRRTSPGDGRRDPQLCYRSEEPNR